MKFRHLPTKAIYIKKEIYKVNTFENDINISAGT